MIKARINPLMGDFASKVYEELKAENQQLIEKNEELRTMVLLLLNKIKDNEKHDVRNLNV